MRRLTDQLLIEAYDQAIKLKLNKEFIGLLNTEIQRRNLNINIHHETALYSSKFTLR